MSEPTSNNGKEFARDAVVLLKDYTQRLQELAKEAFQITDESAALRSGATKADERKRRHLQIRYEVLQQISSRIDGPASNLARVVSQRIEHGKLDELEKAELRLRLADFEGNLIAMQTAINNPPSL